MIVRLFLCAVLVSAVSIYAVDMYRNPAHPVPTGVKIAILSVDTVCFTAYDNTRAMPEILYPDSLLRSDARLMIAGEARKSVGQGVSLPSIDTLSRRPFGGYSILAGDTADSVGLRAWIRQAAAATGATLLVVPYRFKISQKTFQPEAWRDAPGYQQPVKYSARAELLVQIWDKEGNLLFEHIKTGHTGKPIGYDRIKEKLRKKDDPVKYARKFYAPPPLKATFKAVLGIFSAK